MKKTTLIIVALGMITTLAAQETYQPRPSRNNLEVVASALENISNIDYKISDMTAPSFENGIPLKSPKQLQEEADSLAAVDTLSMPSMYIIPDEMYLASANGYPFYFNPAIVLPYRDSVTYYSYFTPGNWTIDTTTVANAPSLTVEAGYVSSLPWLSLADFQPNDSTYVDFFDYSYGNSIRLDYYNGTGKDDIKPILLTGYYYQELVGNCAWSSYDDESVFDYGRIWADKSGPYGYGTNLHFDATKTVDTIGTIFPLGPEDIMYVDTARLRIYTIDYEKSLADTEGKYIYVPLQEAIPEGKEIYLKLYPVQLQEQADGSFINMINTDSVIAEAVATKADIVASPYTAQAPSVNWLGEIAFVFKKKNVLGVSQPKPAEITGRFYAELTGFNEAGCNFGIWCDIDNFTTNGRTIFKVNGQYSTLWQNPHNIDLCMNAIFPHVEPDTTATVMKVPGTGGDALFYDEAGNADENYGEWLGYNSNIIDLNMISYDGDDWLEVTFNDYYAKQNYLYMLAKITADANPTAEAREGKVTLNFAGQKFTYTIQQEAGTSAVENIKHLNDGKMYNVLGMEVDDTYKGIVIKNGEKFIR